MFSSSSTLLWRHLAETCEYYWYGIESCAVDLQSPYRLDKGYFRHTVVAGSVIFVIWFVIFLIDIHTYAQRIYSRLPRCLAVSFPVRTPVQFSHFMLSLVSPHQYYQVFLAQGLGMGIGIGLVYLSTSVIVTQHFKQNKSLAMVRCGFNAADCVCSPTSQSNRG